MFMDVALLRNGAPAANLLPLGAMLQLEISG